MAGSQLKQLKAALKNQGLIGQTNKKRHGKKSTPSETRRDDRNKIVSGIRDQFNQFDQRFDRTKHDVSVISEGKFVKKGSKQHNEATKHKSGVQKTMKMQYELEKAQKNKVGGLVDRRFGENNANLSREEKMLERFTRERQGSARKTAFSLESDDDDDDGFELTHMGKSIDMGDSGKRYMDEEPEAPRKKSKKEVMQEIIAKSKFHKQQRQKAFQAAQEEIMDLDEDFGDVMDEMRGVGPKMKSSQQTSSADMEYEKKVRELTYDRRSVPADRTKTDEELHKERAEKMKKLEDDRLRRMEGSRDGQGDDLDEDEFWEKESGSEGSESESDGEVESGGDEDAPRFPKKEVFFPTSYDSLIETLSAIPPEKQAAHVKQIVSSHLPHLAEGNKQKMDSFVPLLVKYVLHLVETSSNETLIEELSKITKKLAEQYNEALVVSMKEMVASMQDKMGSLTKKDLFLFVLIGSIFSTSDHYHLVVTPALIAMNQALAWHNTTLSSLAQGVFLADMYLNYQRLSKRYSPELVHFIDKALVSLIPENENGLALDKSDKYVQGNGISLSEVVSPENTPDFKFRLLRKLFAVVNRLADTYRDLAILPEIISPALGHLKRSIRYFGAEYSQEIAPLVTKLTNICNNASRKPLALQAHRAVALKTFAPKFEENFNPDKKSYDDNRERSEMNKIRAQLKKEKKEALRDVRQETRFVASRRIEEKKKMYEEYHKKMASIVNSISTVEGAERNQYEREKKMRKNK